jgi:hypothetical protein
MRHLYCVASGERQASPELLAAIQRELGEDAWLYVCGKGDTLRESASVETQP